MRFVVGLICLIGAACSEAGPTRLDNAEVNAVGALREIRMLKERVEQLENTNSDLEYRLSDLEARLGS